MRFSITLIAVFASTHLATADDAATPEVARFIKLLKHKNPTTRLHAAAALGDLGPDAEAAVPALTQAIDDPHINVRMYAVRSLGRIGKTPTRALLEKLHRLLRKDESWLVARQAAIALEVLTPTHPMADFLLSQRPGVKRFSPLLYGLPLRYLRSRSKVDLRKSLASVDYSTALSAVLEMRSRYSNDELAEPFIPLLFHPADRIRLTVSTSIASTGRDGKLAVVLAQALRIRGGHKRVPGLLRQAKFTGRLTAAVMMHAVLQPTMSTGARSTALGGLVRQFGHKNPAVRKATVQALQSFPPETRRFFELMAGEKLPRLKSVVWYGDGALRLRIDRLTELTKPELLPKLRSRNSREVVAAQLLLIERTKAEQLIPAMIPLLFHKSSRVRQIARGFISRQGSDGMQAARLAFHAQLRSKQIPLNQLVDARRLGNPILMRVLDHLLAEKRVAVQRERFGRFDMILLRGLIRLKKDTPGARRLYARALLSGNATAVKLARRAFDFAGSPVLIAADWPLWLETSDRGALMKALAAIRHGRVDVKQAAPRVASLLTNLDPRIAEAAHRTLAEIGPKWWQVSDVYLRMLDSASAELVSRATHSLARQPRLHAGVVETLRSRLAKARKPQQRKFVLKLLRRIAPGAPAAIALFVKSATRDPDTAVRDEALYGLLIAGRAARGHEKTLFAALAREADPLLSARIVNVLQTITVPAPNGPALTKAERDFRAMLHKLKIRYTTAAAVESLKRIIAAQEQLRKATERHNLETVLGKLRERKE